MMKIFLKVKNLNSKEVLEAVFDHPPVLIGRSKICDLVVDDALASRQQCVIELDDRGDLRVVDLQSANGTLFGGKKITKQSLRTGDSFQIGDVVISLEKVLQSQEETTLQELIPAPPMVHEDTPAARPVGSGATHEKTVLRAVPKKPFKTQSAPQQTPEPAPAPTPRVEKIDQPTVLHRPPDYSYAQLKDWVQVSVFWNGELMDIKCFDRGAIVKIGKAATNDFLIEVPDLPDELSFLKIHPQGVEVNLHSSMTGIVETRGGVLDLAELRKKSRPTEIGQSAFLPFQDRCLFEIGPFSVFIRSVRLRITEDLESPLVKEPLFAGVFAFSFIFFSLFLLFVYRLPQIEAQEEQKDLLVKLEPPLTAPEQVKPLPPPPPPPPKPAVKTGAVKQTQIKESGKQGEGAKAAGEEGKRGRESGRVKASARVISVKTKEAPPKKVAPRGAVGDVKDSSLAMRGKAPDRGIGTGKPKPAGTGTQLGSLQPKPRVRVEDEGVLGVLGGKGGGGTAASGGVLEGTGLSGREDGALEEGLERGSDIDAQGAGGRGLRGRSFGGGGTAIEVGGLGTKGKGGGKAGFGLGSSGTKGDAEVGFVADEVEVRDGLTLEEIERVVRANQNSIRACYDKALIQSGNMDLRGRIQVKFFVNNSGRATNIVRQSAFGEEAGLFECIQRQIASWQFPKPRGGSGAEAVVPFTFQKEAR